jgi:hypothetical protein
MVLRNGRVVVTRAVIVLNGPRNVGKDTLARHVMHSFNVEIRHAKISDELKVMTHAMYGRPDLPANTFEEVKDLPCDLFFGRTPRDTYISVSENHIKRFHGQSFLGDQMARRLKLEGVPDRMLLDSGFAVEAKPVLDCFDRKLLIRIRRAGHGFEGDSRSYMSPDELGNGVEVMDFDNRDLHGFLKKGLDDIIRPFFLSSSHSITNECSSTQP